MIENLFGGFPSLHPLVVHFPIVLLSAAPFFQAGGLLFRKRDWLFAAALLLAAGTAGIVVASYFFHAEPINPTPEVRVLFARHEAYAGYTLWAALAALAIRALALVRSLRARSLELALLVAMIGAALLVAVAGHLGAELTHIFHVKAE